MGDIAPFKRSVDDLQRDLDKAVASGDFSPYDVMIWRDAIELGNGQLKSHPEIALSFTKQRAAGGTAENRWILWIIRQAMKFRDPSFDKPDDFRLLETRYHALANRIFENAKNLVELGKLYEENYRLWTVKSHPLLKDVAAQIAYAMRTYPGRHLYEVGFMDMIPEEAFTRLLKYERPDLDAALRLVAQLPGDTSWMPLPRPAPGSDSSDDDRPLYQDVIEFAIGCIPVVGSFVMAYEAVAGQDLFGNDLSELQRGVLAAGVLLPMVSRLVEGERAVYSAERMSRLYGGEVRTWENSLALGEKMSAEGGSLKTLRAAGDALAAGKSIAASEAADLSRLLKSIDIAKAGQGTPTALSKLATDTFQAMVASNKRLAELDANAIERILKKKLSSAVKGQLFEELLENRIAVWLNDPAGKAALGLTDVAGRIEFIPGHLITSRSGRQLTDGMLVTRTANKEYRVLAVFEAKSGADAAQGLSRSRVSLGRMSKADKAELRAEAEDAFAVLTERAKRTGTKVTMTVDDIMKEIAGETADETGQIRRDIERLYGSATDSGTADEAVFIGAEEVTVHISPKFTRFFGVVPSDVSLTTVAKELQDQGISNFVALGISYTQKELNDAADLIKTALGLKK